jgi:hypothetical protein
VSPVKYKLGFYIPEDTILLSHRRENLKSYIVLKFREFWRNVGKPSTVDAAKSFTPKPFSSSTKTN